MKAVVYHEREQLAVEDVDEPRIIESTDAIIKVTSSAICGSDLHLYGGFVPGMMDGDILGHEFMGEIVELGTDVHHVNVGDRVIVPFVIACGECYFCKAGMYALCDTTNPNHAVVEAMHGHSPSGYFGFSHLYGGYPGGQAQYVRVPYANVGLFAVPDHLTDEQVLFLTDVFPTGYMAVEDCGIQPSDTVAIWGGGPVGQFAAKSAQMLGAQQIILIDREQVRLDLAEKHCGAVPINFADDDDIHDHLKELTNGRGPDVCVDAVGLEAHGTGIFGAYDKLKQVLRMENDRPAALRQAIKACRKGGTVSVPGVYGGFVDKFPMGTIFAKDLHLRSGQTHVQKYVPELLDRISQGEVDPSYIITHTIGIDEAPDAYKMFRDKEDDCVKVVMKPNG